MRPTPGLLIAVLAASVGCDRAPAPKDVRSSGPPPASAAASRPAPEAAPALAAEPVAQGTLAGSVLETMDAGGYTYLHLQTDAGPAWAAVNQAKVAKGDRVTVVGAITMVGFQSPTLGRRFDRIVFGTLAAKGGSASSRAAAVPAQKPAGPSAMPGALAAQHAAAAAGPAEVGPIHLAKADVPDGRTVAEVYADRARLEAKPVAIRGKVVKFSPGIMGRNWVHLRDGSGSPLRRDHDLTVTTDDVAAVGDVVLVRGIVRSDRDFGAGYIYPVIVEEAKLTK